MLKSLTLSMSLALALGFAGVSFAGSGCDTCGMASPQGTVASPQGYTETCDTCVAKKKHSFHMPKFSMPACLKPKPHVYTYEWVLKKKKVHGSAATSCDSCGTAVTPSAQYSSPQAMSAPQSYAAPQSYTMSQGYSAPQMTSMLPTSEMKPAIPMGDSVPPAPPVPPSNVPTPPNPSTPSASQGGNLLYLSPTGN
jgi:hypothetical protein